MEKEMVHFDIYVYHVNKYMYTCVGIYVSIYVIYIIYQYTHMLFVYIYKIYTYIYKIHFVYTLCNLTNKVGCTTTNVKGRQAAIRPLPVLIMRW